MTEEEIVASKEFKAINFIIDEQLEELQGNIAYVRDAFARLSEENKFPYNITTRVSYEEGGRNEIHLGFSTIDTQIDQVLNSLNDIKRLNKLIGDLQFLKLRLLNDYDFTHGDDQNQKKMFGDV